MGKFKFRWFFYSYIWEVGTLVSVDPTAAGKGVRTTMANLRLFAGVVTVQTASGSDAVLVNASIISTVLVQGNVAVGDALGPSSTAGRAAANGGRTLAIAVSAYAGGGAGSVSAIMGYVPYQTTRGLARLATISTGLGAGATVTISHTVDAGSDLLVVRCGSTHNAKPTSITWNGTGLTEVTSKAVTGANSAIYYLKDPAAGTYNIIVTYAGGTNTTAIVENYIGSQATPFRTPLTGTTPNTGLAVGSAALDIVVDVVRNGAALTAGAGQTQQTVGTGVYASYEPGGAGTTTMNWSGTESTAAQCAVAIAGS